MRATIAGIALVVVGLVGACAPAPTVSAKLVLRASSTCEAIATKTGDTWSVHLTKSGSRCGLRMGPSPYRYGLPAGTVTSMIGRDLDLHVWGTGTCTGIFLNPTTYQYSARTKNCRA